MQKDFIHLVYQKQILTNADLLTTDVYLFNSKTVDTKLRLVVANI